MPTATGVTRSSDERGPGRADPLRAVRADRAAGGAAAPGDLGCRRQPLAQPGARTCPADFDDNRERALRRAAPAAGPDRVHRRPATSGWPQRWTGSSSALATDTRRGAITTRGGEPWISVPAAGALPEPANLGRLKDAVIRPAGAPWTCWTCSRKPTSSPTSPTSSPRWPPGRCIDRGDAAAPAAAGACSRWAPTWASSAIVATGEHGETEAALRHVRRLFVTRDNLRRAIATLVNATFAARDPRWWGTGTACASDSKKFGSWESNLMTEWHSRYGGPGRDDLLARRTPKPPASTASSRPARPPRSRR